MIKIEVANKLAEEYGLEKEFYYWKTGFEHIFRKYYVLFCSGDLEINGDLCLDQKNNWRLDYTEWLKSVFGLDSPHPDEDYGLPALIVMGNLKVNGSVINADGSGGACLFVKGNLTANNLVAGGAIINVEGNANIKECILAHYNDGILQIRGVTNAPIYISADHASDVKLGENRYKFNSHEDEHDDYDEDSDKEFCISEISSKLKPLLIDGLETFDDIWQILKTGGSVLPR